MTDQEACEQIGIEYKEIPSDGKLYKTAVKGKGARNTSGRIRRFPDGKGGVVMNNTESRTLTYWYDETPAKTTAADWELRTARIALEERERELLHRQCREKSLSHWQTVCVDGIPTKHPYLIAKQIKPYGARFQSSGGLIVVPARDIDGLLHGLQFISGTGEKKFKTGTVKKGHFHEMPGNEQIIICEGFATGATIHHEIGATVIVAFDAGNLSPVASVIRLKHPDREIIIAADNDLDREDNPGVTKGTKAAHEIGAKLAVVQFTPEQVATWRQSHNCKAPTDFNDLMQIINAGKVSP